MSEALNKIMREGGVKNRDDAEKVVRLVYREYADGSKSYTVQMVSYKNCDECGADSLEWRDMQNFPLKGDSKQDRKDAKKKAIHARLNAIDLLVSNTISREREVF